MGSMNPPTRISELISKKKPKMQVQLDVRFGDLLQLEGYSLHTDSIEQGGRLDLSLYLRALKPIPKGWQLFYHGHFTKGKKFKNLKHKPLAGAYPISEWKTDEYITDRLRYRISSKVPGASLLQLRLGMWKGKVRQKIYGAHGRPSQKK